jgi:hypothetical protein
VCNEPIPTSGTKIYIAGGGEAVLPSADHRPIKISHGVIDLEDISDNECVEIDASEAVSYFMYHTLDYAISTISRKLRLGGELVIGGVDARLMSLGYLNGNITEEQFNEASSQFTCLTTSGVVTEKLSDAGVTVIHVTTDKMFFRIKATRR